MNQPGGLDHPHHSVEANRAIQGGGGLPGNPLSTPMTTLDIVNDLIQEWERAQTKATGLWDGASVCREVIQDLKAIRASILEPGIFDSKTPPPKVKMWRSTCCHVIPQGKLREILVRNDWEGCVTDAQIGVCSKCGQASDFEEEEI